MRHCIAFPGGAYGNFIGFTLDWLQGNLPLDSRPFNGLNSHSWQANFPRSFDEACEEPLSSTNVLTHVIENEQDNFIERMERLHESYDKIIYLYPALSDFVWHLNNKQTKMYKGDTWTSRNKVLLAQQSDKWQGNELWEHREQLSYFWHGQNYTECAIDCIDLLDSKYIKAVPMHAIRDNFYNTVVGLADWLGLEVVRTSEEIVDLHIDWTSVEPHLYKDRLTNQLVDATINNENMDMINLTIVDESQIQRKLRLKGYEIKCYGLNIWPANTTELKELLYETVG